ncbi:hypothetical protein ACPWT1_21930 [Ramlibacter sp. MMS24-I3-19]|uniref:hypothetical protein n=1 Tax=Ramlibacter sp. MMS24-I3-19 TaxID=3416606 RepID=UPI003CFDB79B
MTPDPLDPTLQPAPSSPPQLDDGCSPPGALAAAPRPQADTGDSTPVDPSLWAKSEF